MTLVAAADGSALGNPGSAGWAWYIDDGRWRTGGWKHATNNQAELMAVLSLLQETDQSREPLHILCDSQYVINSLTKWLPGWKRKGWRKADGKAVLNRDLFEQLDAALVGRSVTFEWVKGHAGHPLNERVDLLARETALAFQSGRPHAEGPGFGNDRNNTGPGAVAPLAQPHPEPSLFDAFDDLDHKSTPADATLIERALSCERLINGVAQAGDTALAAEFSVHPEASEVLPDGRIVDPSQDLSSLDTVKVSSDVSLELVRTLVLARSLIVLVYTYQDHVCSSIWEQQEGHLLRRFHQATPRS